MKQCNLNHIYRHEDGELWFPGYKVTLRVPKGYSGELLLEHIFTIKADDKQIKCTLYLHKPGEILLSGWLKEPFEYRSNMLQPVKLEVQNDRVQTMQFECPNGFGLKTKIDVAGHGFGALLSGPSERKVEIEALYVLLLLSVNLLRRTTTDNQTTDAPSTPTSAPSEPPSYHEPRYVQCGACAGSGYITCSSCGGNGYHAVSRTRTDWDNNTEYYEERIPCLCGGSGRQSCNRCGGTGQILE